MNKLFVIAVVIGTIALLRTVDAGVVPIADHPAGEPRSSSILIADLRAGEPRNSSIPTAALPQRATTCDTVYTEYQPICAVYQRNTKIFRNVCALRRFNHAKRTRYYKVKDGVC
ncbi:uncharacterized protein [Anabrus simplex]|uniref:uncharacterized protein n=1 Tax=Anabrus simplex TaxID=316456 RepID=UPI0035A37619